MLKEKAVSPAVRREWRRGGGRNCGHVYEIRMTNLISDTVHPRSASLASALGRGGISGGSELYGVRTFPVLRWKQIPCGEQQSSIQFSDDVR